MALQFSQYGGAGPIPESQLALRMQRDKHSLVPGDDGVDGIRHLDRIGVRTGQQALLEFLVEQRPTAQAQAGNQDDQHQLRDR